MKQHKNTSFSSSSGFLEQIEKFLHFSFKTEENFSYSIPRTRGKESWVKTRPSGQQGRANPRGSSAGDGQAWNWLIHYRHRCLTGQLLIIYQQEKSMIPTPLLGFHFALGFGNAKNLVNLIRK